MQIYINDMLYALSDALDSVEAEIFGVRSHHSERVAYIAIKVGRSYHLSQDELLNLAVAAVLHDNALTEYISVKRQTDISSATFLPSPELLKSHCVMGEKNVSKLPSYEHIKHAILYHHENADGSGAHGLTAKETPLFAQIIHLADQMDVYFNRSTVHGAALSQKVTAYLAKHRDKLFAGELCDKFLAAFPSGVSYVIDDDSVLELLPQELEEQLRHYDNEAIHNIATMFAKIVDYKSHFTCTHSLGIAQKAEQMGRFYGKEDDICTKLYLAGALHDIGKLTISNAILEKPDSLTREEFEIMKGHALASWRFLRPMKGLDEVVSWACMHHEKLNGSGYPFGKKAAELGTYERLLACLDIYQALIEDRPYHKGRTHQATMEILQDMGQKGLLDQQIIADIDQCFRD